MPKPVRALVRPRVVSPVSGDVLLLEDEIQSLLARRKRGTVWLIGVPGSGKSTALAHLAAVLPPEAPVALLDDLQSCDPPTDRFVIRCGEPHRNAREPFVSYRLAPWGEDERIEYLLAAHPDQCAAVMSRCRNEEQTQRLRGTPDLWRPVLDALAGDPGIPSVEEALRIAVAGGLPTAELRDLAANWALAVHRGLPDLGAGYLTALESLCDFPNLLRLLRHAPVLLLLASERIAAELASGGLCEFLKSRLAQQLIVDAAVRIRDDRNSLNHLETILRTAAGWDLQPMAASLLFAAVDGWRPPRRVVRGTRKWLRRERRILPNLKGAHLSGAVWPRIELAGMNLTGANLSSADLSEADLDESCVSFANLSGATLRGASLSGCLANDSVLSGADLSYVRAVHSNFHSANANGATFEGALLTEASFREADLTGTKFVRAQLERAKLIGAKIEGADFSQANLEGCWLQGLDLRLTEFRNCVFQGAHVASCNMEGMSLPGANFGKANLAGALLTASSMAGADFRGASLVNCGLAEIDWERADLRSADLRGASFHMGSSRSGLVDSPIASYGTRTGFYTDDFGDQDFRSPEEIRKANLRGADLRGANIEGVDFYLVDLRNARYDARQEPQLRSTGAILESRVR